MPKRRDKIRMTDDELWKFVEAQQSLQVATIGKDGMPHLTTLWFAVLDGDIVFETFTKSQKIVNLQRDPRISVLVEDGTTYNQLRGATFSGTAELYTEPERIHPVAEAVIRKNQPEVPEDQIPQAAKMMAVKRTAVVVKPTKIVSWDHNKLGGAY
ncbi:MAG: TIGR03618 family F420-dependent PPOX class oxidoreductase [Myxococcota bacterium]